MNLTITDSVTGDSLTTPDSPINIGKWSSQEEKESAYLPVAQIRFLYGQHSIEGFPNVPLSLKRINDEKVNFNGTWAIP